LPERYPKATANTEGSEKIAEQSAEMNAATPKRLSIDNVAIYRKIAGF